MARRSDSYPEPEKTIRFYQNTIQDLSNNTLTKDLTTFLVQLMNEGYCIEFIGIQEKDNTTKIQSFEHLLNYIKHIQRY
jgi:hypothetical protein